MAKFREENVQRWLDIVKFPQSQPPNKVKKKETSVDLIEENEKLRRQNAALLKFVAQLEDRIEEVRTLLETIHE